jgi:hypothetical protein
VSRDLSRTSCFLGGSLDQDALVEPGASTDQRDEVECVDGAPAAFGGLDDLERHRAAAAPAGRVALSLVSGAGAPLKQTLLAVGCANSDVCRELGISGDAWVGIVAILLPTARFQDLGAGLLRHPHQR